MCKSVAICCCLCRELPKRKKLFYGSSCPSAKSAFQDLCQQCLWKALLNESSSDCELAVNNIRRPLPVQGWFHEYWNALFCNPNYHYQEKTKCYSFWTISKQPCLESASSFPVLLLNIIIITQNHSQAVVSKLTDSPSHISTSQAWQTVTQHALFM